MIPSSCEDEPPKARSEHHAKRGFESAMAEPDRVKAVTLPIESKCPTFGVSGPMDSTSAGFWNQEFLKC